MPGVALCILRGMLGDTNQTRPLHGVDYSDFLIASHEALACSA
jgi:hypothetical protein